MDESSIHSTYNALLKGSYHLMTLFHLRCAIISLYGIDMKRDQLMEIVSMINSSDLTFIENSTPISYSVFYKVCRAVESKHILSRPLFCQKQFKHFDRKNRGFVDKDEFCQNMSIVAPRLCSHIGADVFMAVDSHNIGKVAYSQFAESSKMN